jgi:hypothetical protein
LDLAPIFTPQVKDECEAVVSLCDLCVLCGENGLAHGFGCPSDSAQGLEPVETEISPGRVPSSRLRAFA